ncbi:MAG TPA: DUF4326 domain-containing protein [Thermodesulfobacteriota bacterium]|nr:DUF4326 domain-containing protein [Thermodesulfobacteriota bacterium]
MKRKPTVFNLKHEHKHICGDPNVVYIGRESPRLGLKRSKWHNPYHVCAFRIREEACWLYREYLLYHKELLDRLPELEGKRLGCYCKPELCHGDILVELFMQRVYEPIRR